MNARKLIQILKGQLDLQSEIEETEIQTDIIGTSSEAKANVYEHVMGKTAVYEVTSKFVGFLE